MTRPLDSKFLCREFRLNKVSHVEMYPPTYLSLVGRFYQFYFFIIGKFVFWIFSIQKKVIRDEHFFKF